MLVSDMPAANARRAPERLAASDDSRSVSWAELHERVERLATVLRSGFGLQPGERVSVVAENRVECLELSYATARAGLTYVPLNHRLTGGELAKIVEDADSRVVFFSRRCGPQAAALGDTGVALIPLDDPAEDGYAALLRRARPGGWSPPTPTDRRAIVYTSGTTGRAKGVVHTHANVAAFSLQQQITQRLRPEERHLLLFPMGLLGGSIIPGWHGYQAGSTVMMSDFDPERVLATIEREHITAVLLAPTMINALTQVERPSRFDLSSLRSVVYGSSPISVDVLARALELFPAQFTQVYGLTEACGFLLALPPEEHALDDPDRLGTAGRELPNAHVRLVDEQDSEVPDGEVGEIVARSAQIMSQYWSQPDETAVALRGGWLRTGDIGRRRPDRSIELVDRKKDLIVSGGLNVYPKEVEAVLHRHPGVLEAAVIGIPDDHWGEAVHAAVVPRAGVRLQAEELISFCREHIAGYKKPRSVAFLDALPLNATGKVDKNVLRAPFWQEVGRAVH